MSDKERNCSNEAVEKMIGNMTAEMQNVDGQYVPLGYTPPPPSTVTTTTPEQVNWSPTTNTFNNYNPYNHGNDIPLGYVALDQFGQINQPFNFLPHQLPHHVFDYKNVKFDIYNPLPNGCHDRILSNDYLMNSNLHQQNDHNNIMQTGHNSSQQLIENLVGNWAPNTSGTYTPFGSVDHFNQNINVFEKITNDKEPITNNLLGQVLDEAVIDQPIDEKHFQFNLRNNGNGSGHNNKPRMVAEVKPMRPTYSDILTKPVPPTTTNVTMKPTKIDAKEIKQKKDGKKINKNEKITKIGVNLSRSNTNNDIKEINEKTNQFNMKHNEKLSKIGKGPQLNRKWASLDNINEPFNNTKQDEGKKKKIEDLCTKSINNNNNTSSSSSSSSSSGNNNKMSFKKIPKTTEIFDNDTGNKNETLNISKNGVKKTNKFISRLKTSESFNGNERPPGKRNQRNRKRENHEFLGVIGQKLKHYLKSWWKFTVVFVLWIFHMISDICSLSLHISRDAAQNFWQWSRVHWHLFMDTTVAILKRIRIFTWIYEKFKRKDKQQQQQQQQQKEANRSFLHNGLQNNINMPTTGEEAMKRLLACKGKDPYSILGVTPTCSDDDIKRYYKRQAFLVHPDKNQQPGAEEAFKILVHAFDMIGEPERRAAYDKGVVESVQMEQARSELIELLEQLQQKMEAAANTIRCSTCGSRHKRMKIDRPSYAARNCATCKIHHSAREGDIWAEARCFGFLWHYYACMDGGVYDITEWAACQKDSLKHLRPDSHQVQYRIALGKQNNYGGNNFNNSQSTTTTRRFSHSPRTDNPSDLENYLNTLYKQADSMQGTRRKTKKANK